MTAAAARSPSLPRARLLLPRAGQPLPGTGRPLPWARRPPARPASTVTASRLRGWGRRLMLPASVTGVPLVLVLPRLGRGGGLLVTAASGLLFARDLSMTVTGVPAGLRVLPRLLLFAEVAVSGTASAAGLLAWGRQRAGAGPAATAAAAGTFVLHSVRVAIYLSPGSGRREHPGQ